MNLHRLFSPRSIIVIGVSQDPRKLGSLVYRNIIDAGFTGTVSIVHPTAKRLFGKKPFASVSSAPRSDLAVIVTPAATVNAIVKECGEKGILNVIVISAGFRESGKEGLAREQELQRIAKRFGIQLIGPNCLGVIHGASNLNASFALPLSTKGDTVLVSQSGAMAVAITDWARIQQVNIRSLISMGNKAVIAEHHLLEYLANDTGTKRILMYLESIADGKRLLRIARKITRKIPIIVLFAGSSKLAQQASSSHTGAIASQRSVVIAALHEAGVVTVDSIEDLFNAATVFSHTRLLRGNRVAVVTNAGGPGIMAIDALANTHLQPVQYADSVGAMLRAKLPSASAIGPLVDLLGDANAKRYADAISIIGSSQSADAIAVILTAQVGTDAVAIAKVLVNATRRFPHLAIVASFVGGAAVLKARKALAAGHIAHFDVPEDAIQALAMVSWYTQHIRNRAVLAPPKAKKVKALQLARSIVSPQQSMQILKAYGFTALPTVLCREISDVVTAARRISFPLVLKVVHPDIIHKARQHAVWTGILNDKQLRLATRQAGKILGGLPKQSHAGILLQQHVVGGREWFLGGANDPTFGSVVIIARGGTFVEEENRAVTMLASVDMQTIRQHLLNSILSPIFTSIVGKQDLPYLVRALKQLGQFLADHPEVRSVDINPYIVNSNDSVPVIIDARIVV